ncbi:MAG: hypothetical protein LUQ13_00305, partial [Methanomicrobiales archaeon]|nr:hypothetical protein [Methanomicrobiales archaeon]
RLSGALNGGSFTEEERETIRLCSIDRSVLRAMAEMVLTALDVLKQGQPAGVVRAPADPGKKILMFLATPRDPPLFGLEEILTFGKECGFSEKDIRLALEALLEDGECYMPRNGLIKLV